MDPLPNRLSLQSSEGGSIDSDEKDMNDDGGSLMAYSTPYATPVHLKHQQTTSHKGNPPSGVSSFDDEDESDDLQKKKVSSPSYPGLTSLLGQASDSEGTDDDRSVVQFLDGSVSHLKMSDLEATHRHDSSDDDIATGLPP
jgi:hypothetical protein